jgi:hypothetical protein
MDDRQDRLSRALDEALQMTFPASDPVAIAIAHPAGEEPTPPNDGGHDD